jgi:hypothetical protein
MDTTKRMNVIMIAPSRGGHLLSQHIKNADARIVRGFGEVTDPLQAQAPRLPLH